MPDERVVRGRCHLMSGLPLRMELRLHDLLIIQMDRELTCHQFRVNYLGLTFQEDQEVGGLAQ